MKLHMFALFLLAVGCDRIEPDQSLVRQEAPPQTQAPSKTEAQNIESKPAVSSQNAAGPKEPIEAESIKPQKLGLVNVDLEFEFLNEKKVLSYADDIKPILDQHCAGCHGTAGEMNLREFNFTWYDDNSDEIQNDIVDEMIVRMEDEDDPMPPLSKSKKTTQMVQQDIDKIKKWQNDGLKKVTTSNQELSVILEALDASGAVVESQTQMVDASGLLNAIFQADGIEAVQINVFKSKDKLTSKTIEVTGMKAKSTVEIDLEK